MTILRAIIYKGRLVWINPD